LEQAGSEKAEQIFRKLLWGSHARAEAILHGIMACVSFAKRLGWHRQSLAKG
jgi:hypothetical protein